LQTLAVEVDESEVGDIITSGVVPPLIRALERHPNPEEELAALQNLGAATVSPPPCHTPHAPRSRVRSVLAAGTACRRAQRAACA